MDVRTTNHNGDRTVHIVTPTRDLDIHVPKGADEADTLRTQAAEWEAQAARLLSMAADCRTAAGIVDEGVLAAFRASLIAKGGLSHGRH